MDQSSPHTFFNISTAALSSSSSSSSYSSSSSSSSSFSFTTAGMPALNPSSMDPNPLQQQPAPTLSLLPLSAMLLLTPLMTTLIVVSAGSNLLVLLSYKPHMLFLDAQSLYLLHLAVSDLLISLFCMPLHTISTLWSSGWPLSRAVCQLYTAVQLTLLNVSTLLLVLVALDELQQAEEGVRSTGREARRKAYVWLSLCWLLAVAVHVPETFSWSAVQGHTYVPDNVCRPEFYRSVGHVLFVQVWSFFLPVLILSVINTRLYFRLRRLSQTMLTFGHGFHSRAVAAHDVTRKQQESKSNSLETQNCTTVSDIHCRSGEFHDLSQIPAQLPYEDHWSKHLAKPGTSKMVSASRSPFKTLSLSSGKQSVRSSSSTGHIGNLTGQAGRQWDRTSGKGRKSRSSSDLRDVRVTDRDTAQMAEGAQQTSRSGGSSAGDGRDSSEAKAGCLTSRSRHVSLETPYRLKRVAVILFTLVLILVVCWLPYSLAFLVRSVCQDCVHPVAYSILVWMLYFKSCINPFLYAYNTFAFRNRYRRLLVRIFPVRRLRRMTTDRVSNERASILN